MAQQIRVDIIVDDQGSAKIANFAGNATASLERVNTAALGQKTFVEQLQSSWIVAGGAIVAAWMAVNKAVDFAEMGAKALQAEDSFRRVADTSGVSADKLIANMKRATAGTVDDSDLMQKAVKGMMLGLSDDAMVKIAEMARLGARVAGVSVEEAITGITNSIATGMPRALKQYGLALGPEVAIITQAQKAGVDGINLMTLATINYDIQLARHGAMQANAIEQYQVFKTEVHDTAEGISKFFISALQGAYGQLQRIGAQLEYAAGATNILLGATVALAAWTADKLGFTEKAKVMKEYADFATETGNRLIKQSYELNAKGLANITGNLSAATEATKSAASEQSQATIKELLKQKEAFLQSVKDQTAAAKDGNKTASDLLKSMTEENKQAYESQFQAADQAYKMAAASGENELEAVNAMYDSKKNALDNWYNKQVDAIDKSVKDEAKKNAAFAALYAEYSKKWDDGENKRALATVDYAQKHVGTMAQLYKTVDQYGADSVKADADKLLKKYIDLARYVTPGSGEMAVLWAAYYKELDDQGIKANDARQKSLQTYITWETDTLNKQIETEKTKGGDRVKISAKMWDDIAYYERLTGDKMTKDQYDDVELMTKEYTDTFAGGISKAFADIEDKAIHWGDVAYNVVSNFAKDASSTASKYFFDVIKGNLDEQEKQYRAAAAQQTADVTAESDKAIKAILDAEKQKYSDIQKLYDAGTISFAEAESQKATAHTSSLDAMKLAADAAAAKIDDINTTMNGKIDDLGFNWGKLWDGMLASAIDGVTQMAVNGALVEGWKAVKEMFTGKDGLGSSWTTMLGGMLTEFGNWASKLPDLVSKAWDAISSAASYVADWLTAKEGMWSVPGGAAGEDGAVPIIAHEGEMILKKGLAQEVRNYIKNGELMNSGQLVTGAGGIVGAIIGNYIGSWAAGQLGVDPQIGGAVGSIGGGYLGAKGGAALASYYGLTSAAGTAAGVTAAGGGSMAANVAVNSAFLASEGGAFGGVEVAAGESLGYLAIPIAVPMLVELLSGGKALPGFTSGLSEGIAKLFGFGSESPNPKELSPYMSALTAVLEATENERVAYEMGWTKTTPLWDGDQAATKSAWLTGAELWYKGRDQKYTDAIGEYLWGISPYGPNPPENIKDVPYLSIPQFESGIDYIPRNRYLNYADEGEAILPKREAAAYRAGKKGQGGYTLNFHFPNALSVDRSAVNELAELIFPRLQKLTAWGH